MNSTELNVLPSMVYATYQLMDLNITRLSIIGEDLLLSDSGTFIKIQHSTCYSLIVVIKVNIWLTHNYRLKYA